MKKVFLLLLAATMCFSLVACSGEDAGNDFEEKPTASGKGSPAASEAADEKSEAVKRVESMIDALGEITLESNDSIQAAEAAYSALAEADQKNVANYETLTAARDTYNDLSDAYYEEALVGEWVIDQDIIIMRIDVEYERRYLSLNPDMSCTLDGETGWTWHVEDGILYYGLPDSPNSHSTRIIDENGRIRLHAIQRDLIRLEERHNLLNEIFKIVDLSEVDVNDYLGFHLYEEHGVDDFGEPTGDVSTMVMLRNKLFEDGWYCIDGSDIVIEVNFPEENITTTYADGRTTTDKKEAYTETIRSLRGVPFDSAIAYTDNMVNTEQQSTTVSDFTVEQLSFGRAKGVLYFVHGDYVKEAVCSKERSRRELVFVENHPFAADSISCGAWYEGLDY